jgi:hypothetical protein
MRRRMTSGEGERKMDTREAFGVVVRALGLYFFCERALIYAVESTLEFLGVQLIHPEPFPASLIIPIVWIAISAGLFFGADRIVALGYGSKSN